MKSQNCVFTLGFVASCGGVRKADNMCLREEGCRQKMVHVSSVPRLLRCVSPQKFASAPQAFSVCSFDCRVAPSTRFPVVKFVTQFVKFARDKCPFIFYLSKNLEDLSHGGDLFEQELSALKHFLAFLVAEFHKGLWCIQTREQIM